MQKIIHLHGVFLESLMLMNGIHVEITEWNGSSGDDGKLKEIGNNIIGPIQVIGSLVSVIAIIIIGIRYMLASVEEKAQYKETLGPYLIGAVFVFAITNILSIVYDIAISIE